MVHVLVQRVGTGSSSLGHHSYTFYKFIFMLSFYFPSYYMLSHVNYTVKMDFSKLNQNNGFFNKNTHLHWLGLTAKT